MTSPGTRITRRSALAGSSLFAACLALLRGPPALHAAESNLPAPAASPPSPRGPLGGVASWGYQLQKVDPQLIARSPFEVMVIDYSRDGSDERRFRPDEVAAMRRTASGGTRVLLAYLSIGEAEDYRVYWNEEWVELDLPDDVAKAVEAARDKLEAALQAADARGDGELAEQLADQLEALKAKHEGVTRRPNVEKAPGWLGEENEEWRSNFFVKYWEKPWQDLMFGTPEALLDKIIAAGFDGVYLDRVDAYYQFIDERESAKRDMVDFVRRLSAYARALRPGFVIVPQNGEELLRIPDYLAVIDGIAKEDLFYGTAADDDEPAQSVKAKPSEVAGAPSATAPNAKVPAKTAAAKKSRKGPVANSAGQVKASLRRLTEARAAGLPVLVVEYFNGRKLDWIADARQKITANGFIGYIGVRELDRLVLPGEKLPVSAADQGSSRRGSSKARSKAKKPDSTPKRRN